MLTPKRSFFTIIRQAEEGWKLTLGKNPVKLNPGIRLKIPLYHTVDRVDMRERKAAVHKLNAYTHDNVPVTVSGTLFFRVIDSYKACFDVQNYDEGVSAIGASTVRSIIGTKEYDKIISDRNGMNADLRKVIGTSIASWGVECTKFEIQEFSPSNRDVERQLEQQMEAERNRRKQVLDTEAGVNVAEGQKRKAILESEGLLQAKRNQTDAEFYKEQKQADAKKYAIETETSAVSDQMKELTKLLRTPDRVTSFLLESRRLTHLSSIAANSGNKVYFIPPDKAYPLMLPHTEHATPK